jgi:hypothetical protein
MKKCIKCDIIKDDSEYYANNNQCIDCKKIYQNNLIKNKLEEDSKKEFRVCKKCGYEKSKIEFNKYGNKCKICEGEYYQKNKEKISSRKKKYNLENPEKRKENWNNYYSLNKESVLEKRRMKYNKEYKNIYYQKNKEKIISRVKERYDSRIKNEPLFKLKYVIRSIVRNSLLNKGFKKNTRTEKIIGCSCQEFKVYLESKFEDWMNWDNHGKYNGELNYGWDIDHIIPTSSAKTEEEVIKLNHYTNLQPLCSYINRYVKKNKI